MWWDRDGGPENSGGDGYDDEGVICGCGGMVCVGVGEVDPHVCVLAALEYLEVVVVDGFVGHASDHGVSHCNAFP